MNIKNFLHENKNILSRIIITLLILLSILSIFVNRGLYFYEDHDNIKITFEGDNDKIIEVMDKLSINSNVAKVDRNNKSIIYEGLDKNSVAEIASKETNESGLITTLTENLYNNSENLKNISFISLSLLAASLGSYLYFIFKIKQKFNIKQILLTIFSYLLCFALSSLIIIGIISMISRFYQVRSIDLFSILIAQLWISILFFFAIWELKYEKYDSINSLYSTLDLRKLIYVKIAITLIVVITISLGASFVIPAMLISLSLILSNFLLNNIGNILTFDINLKPPSLRFIPLFRAIRNRSKFKDQIAAPTEIKETKISKKKKKKKNK